MKSNNFVMGGNEANSLKFTKYFIQVNTEFLLVNSIVNVEKKSIDQCGVDCGIGYCFEQAAMARARQNSG